MSDCFYTRYDMHVQRVKACVEQRAPAMSCASDGRSKTDALLVELPVRHRVAASWAVEVAHACLSHATFS